MKFLIFTLCALVGLNVHASDNAFTESLKEYSSLIRSTTAENPFKTGTQKIVLTEQDKATLAQYAYNSKSLLERALRAASGKPLEEVHEIYVEAIKQVVIESYADKKRSELLMRYALNQALQLTIGVPSANGKSILEKGVLSDVNNVDVVTAILEDSMHLAIRYYRQDHIAIQSGQLIKLPYIHFGNERLAMATKWSHSVHQPELLLQFQVKMLEQWMSTVANNEVLDRLKIAEAILDVDAALVQVKETQYTHLQKIRYLRGVVDTLFDTLRRLGLQVTESAKPALSAPQQVPQMIITLDIRSIDGYSHLEMLKHQDFRSVVGQGYTNNYYVKSKRAYVDDKYKSYTEKDFYALVEKTCNDLMPNPSRTVYCGPTYRIPRINKYVSNREFQENHTVDFVIAVFSYSLSSN